MRNSQITCDACGGDLTTTGNCVDYRLMLLADPIPNRGGVVTAMMIHPPVQQDHHFCGIMCLGKWLKTNHPKAIE